MSSTPPETAVVVDASLREAFPPARCARIAASLDLAPEHRAEILAAADITDDAWEAVVDHWDGAVETAAARGDTSLLTEMDRAYLDRCEEDRGPLTGADYASLVVATERGAAAHALEALQLPPASQLRIARAWLAKLSEDPALRKEINALVERTRDAH